MHSWFGFQRVGDRPPLPCAIALTTFKIEAIAYKIDRAIDCCRRYCNSEHL
ncbi:MAG: hypothetical protein VKL59_24650 [Nostocaceae cyanobacterium]|nr:hypothetical protein [Nostocaceae cyanobacterium]